MTFAALPFPNAELMAAVERLAPYSPFNTARYATAIASLGARAYVFTADGGASTGCVGFVRRGRLAQSLTVPSLPSLADPQAFFEGLHSFCRAQRVWDIVITTFGSNWHGAIPTIGLEIGRRERWEFALALAPDRPFELSSGHRRNVKKAERSGVTWRRTRDAAAAELHRAAFRASMDRRSARGEEVDMAGGVREAAALLASGAGELFQAVHHDVVVSSLLVVRSSRNAYYHSAGTTPDGMELGASPYLVASAAQALAADGLSEFNLGGAEPARPGLYRFKEGFGGTVRQLEMATFTLAAPWWRAARAVVSRVLALRGSRR